MSERPTRNCRPVPRRCAAYGITCVAGLLLPVLTLAGGCKSDFRDTKPTVLITQGDAVHYVGVALDSKSPDERRKAINRLAQSRYVADPTTLKALALIARSDTSQSVRSAALIAMGGANEPIVAEAALDVLRPERRMEAAAPPDADVRMAAARNLVRLAEADGIPDELDELVCDTAIVLTRSDPSRNVRVAGAQLLGYFPDKKAAYTLADALDQRDFAVCYEAEHSLMRLTGQSFGHDADKWRRFVASTDDPFAQRGALDDELKPREKGWLSFQ